MSGPSDPEAEWQFGVDEVGEDAEPVREPIDPGTPRAENVLFVLLGVCLAVGVLLVSVGIVP